MKRRIFLKKGIQAGALGLFTLGSPINLYSEEGKLCVVLDDACSSLATASQLERLAEQNIPVTVSVLPNSAYEKTVLDILSQYKNADILLHQPMQPENMEEDMKKAYEKSQKDYTNRGKISLLKNPTIFDFHEPKDAVWIIRYNINHINNYLRNLVGTKKIVMGLNNHQGSLITQKENFMRAIAEYCFNPQNNLILLDSRTTPESVMYDVAKEVAKEMKEKNPYARCYKSDYCIDHEKETKEEVLTVLNRFDELTKKGDNVILIGHLTKQHTIDALIEFYQQNKSIIKDKKNLVRISDLQKF